MCTISEILHTTSLAETWVPLKETWVPLKETWVPLKETRFHINETWVPIKETWVPLKETWVPLEETRFHLKETWVPLKETWVPLKETWVPFKETWVPLEGNTISPEGNVSSHKGNVSLRMHASGSLPGPEPTVVASALVFLQKIADFRHPQKIKCLKSIFSVFWISRFFAPLKKDRCRTKKETDCIFALVRKVGVPAPHMCVPVEHWRKNEENCLKFRKNRSRTHVRELQLFARNLHKNVLQKYFLWSNQKKVVKTEKKLDQILKNLMKNLIQIWFKFEFEKKFKFKPNSFEFEFEKFFKLDSNLNPIWVSFLTRSFCYFAKFECLRTWQVYNT